MRNVGEYVGMTLFLLLCLWIGVVCMAPRQEKPLAACRPLTSLTRTASDAFVAISPGGDLQRVANAMNAKLAQGCLTYTGNLFEVARKE